MKLFCAYAFTGEDIATVNTRMQLVVNTLKANNHIVYCNRFDPVMDRLRNQGDLKGIFYEAFKHLAASEAVVAIISSPNRSVGQLMELGIALSQNKPVYLFEHISAKDSTYLPRLADKHVTWQNVTQLVQALSRL